MMRCLSDTSLERLLADLGTADERAHLAACPACAARYQSMLADLATVARVLVTADPPAARPARPFRTWPSVAALAAVAAGVLLWLVPGLLTPDPPVREEAHHGQVAVTLADISSSLFSVDGEPEPVPARSPMTSLSSDDDAGAACGDWWRQDGACGDSLAVLVGAIDPTIAMHDDPDSGGEP
jgi:hypothetical protein